MLTLLATLRKLRLTRQEDGFTVLELLIVLIVVAILAGMAIPLLLNYQREAVDAGIKSDVRNTVDQVNEWMGRHQHEAVDNTADYVKESGRVVKTREQTYLGITIDAKGSFTVCAFDSGSNKYKVAENAWAFSSLTGKFGMTTTDSCGGAVDSAGNDASTTVKAPAWSSSGTLPRAEVDTGYSVLLTATGKPAPTYKLHTGDTLPEGMKLDETSGTLNGTPSATGLYTFTIDASNTAGTASREFTLRVVPVTSLPDWNTGVALPDGKVGVDYATTLDAVGNPTPSYELQDGSSLPEGLSLNKTSGKISGTPTAAGDSSFVIFAKNTRGSTPRTFYVHVRESSEATPGDDSGDGSGDGDAEPDPDPSESTPTTGGGNPTTDPSTDPTTPPTVDPNSSANDLTAPEWKTAATLTAGMQGSDYSKDLNASGKPAPTFALGAGSDLPAGLSLNKSTGEITGTPTAYGTFNFKVVAKNSQGSASRSFSIAVARKHVAPTWTTATTLPGGEQDADYSTTVEANGYPDATYSLQDGAQLPAGLTLNTETGKISGSPTVWGTQSFTLLATNDAGHLSRTFLLTIIKHRIAPEFVSDAALVDGEQGIAYNAQVSATGEPAPTFALASGAQLPAGLDLDKNTGAISGTPTVFGSKSFDITATNSKGSVTRTFTLNLVQHRVIPTWNTPANALVDAEQGVDYSAQLSANGVPTPTFSASGFPAGLGVDKNTGVISGSPTEFGDFTVSVTATNSKGSASRNFPLHVIKHRIAPAFTTDVQLAAGEQGYAYSKQLAVSGDTEPAATFTLADGSTLPAGLSMSNSGAISGTPTAYGDFIFTVIASNSKGSDTRTFFVSFEQFRVSPTFTTPTTLANGEQGESYSAQIKTSGVPTPKLALTADSVLPDGLTFDSSTGNITGTPTVFGNFTFTVTATNSKSSTSATFNLAIAKHRVAPAFTTDVQLSDGEQGEAYAQVLHADSAVPAATFTLADGSTLPSGLRLSSNGTVSGTPTVYGSFTFTVTATNSKGSDTRTFFVNLAQARIAPTFNGSASLGAGEQGTSYSTTISASGIPTPVLSLATGSSIPAGLTFDLASGAISGTPTSFGNFSFTVIATNSKGSDTRTYTMAIAQKRVVPAFTTAATLADGEEAVDYSVTINASGVPTPNYALAAGSTVPAGLAFDGATGIVSGKPTTAGSYSFTVTATNSKGSDTRTFNIYVAPHRVVPTWNTGSTLPSGEVNSSYFTAIAASGVPLPYYAITDGTLPDGLVFNGATGSISGTPTAVGSSTFTVSATNVAGTITRTFTLAVGAQRIAPVWTTDPSLTNGTQGTAYSASLVASGTPAPTYALAPGSNLPAGLSLTNTGVIAGTPTGYGSYSFTVIATNSKDSVSRNFTVSFAQNLVVPAWNTGSTLPDGTQSAAYNTTISASGYPAGMTYTLATGSSLPTGFTLDAGTGALAGTSATYGSYSFTVVATNTAGSTNRTFTLYFKPAPFTSGVSGAETSDTNNAQWTTYNGSSNVVPTRATTPVHSGSNSFQSNIAYPYTTYAGMYFTPNSTQMKGGKTYTVSAWVYISGTASRTVQMYSGTYNTGTLLSSVTGTQTSGWQQITGTVTVAPGATAPGIYFFSTTPANAFYVDDLSMVTDTTPQLPKANFTMAVSDTTSLKPSSYAFDATTSINVAGTAPYVWNWGDGTANTTTASKTATHTFTTAGTYTVTLSVVNTDGGPSDTTTRTVSVDPTAVIYNPAETGDSNNQYEYSYNYNTNVQSSGLSSNFAHTGTSSYLASFGNAYQTSGAHNAYFYPRGLTQGKTYTISAWVYVNANTTPGQTVSLVAGGTVLTSVTTTAAQGWQKVTANWTVPFDYISASTQVYFYSPNNYDFYIDDISYTTDASPALPKAAFSQSVSDTTSLSPASYLFTATGSVNASGPTPYTWDFGDGTTQSTTSNSITHTFTSVGSYTVKLTVQNTSGGPTASTTRTISVNPGAVIYATGETNDSNNNYQSSYGYNTNAATSNYTTTAYAHTGSSAYVMAFGSNYQTSGGHTMYFYPRNLVRGKTYAITAWMYVNGSTETMNLSSSGTSLTTLTGSSTNGWQQLSANWTVPFDYVSGTSQLTFYAPNNNEVYIDDISFVTDASAALPKAAFTQSIVDTTSQKPSTYKFDASTSINTSGPTPYTWDFGDGTTQSTTATTINHTYATAGTFNVTLTVQNGSGGPTAISQRTISADPTAVIYATAETGDINNNYQYGYGYAASGPTYNLNTTSYAHTGSSAYSSGFYSTYTYSGNTYMYYQPRNLTAGKTYAFSAWIYNNNGAAQTVTITDGQGSTLGALTSTAAQGWQKVTGSWQAPFNYSSGSTTLTFASNVAGAFYVDDMNFSTDSSPAATNATYTYLVNQGAEYNTKTYTFNPSGSVNASGASAYTWNWGDGTANTVAATAAQQTHTFTAAGTYTVTLTTQNGVGGPTSTYSKTLSASATSVVYATAEDGDNNNVNFGYSGSPSTSYMLGRVSGPAPHTGSLSYSSYNTTNGSYGYFFPANLVRGKTYTVSAWVYINNSTSTINMIDSSNNSVVGSVTGSSASGWQQITATWTAPFSYSSGSSYFAFKNGTTTNQPFNVDDISFSTDSAPAATQANFSLSARDAAAPAYAVSSYLFDASGSINAAGASAYTWNWGDGTANTVSNTSGAIHTYTSAGDFTVTLTTQNGVGGPTATTSRVVTADSTASIYATAEQGDNSNANFGYATPLSSYPLYRPSGIARTGQYSYQSYNTTNGSYGYFYPMASVTRGKTYNVSAWIYTTTASTISMIDSSNNTTLGSVTGTATPGWQKLTATWTAPFTYSSGVNYFNFKNGTTTNQPFNIDDVKFTTDSSPAATKAAFNLTTNGSITSAGYTVDANPSVNASGASAYTYSWGDGTANTVTTSVSSSHVYAVNGTYTITLTTQNGSGGPTDTATMKVTAGPTSAWTATAEGNDPAYSSAYFNYNAGGYNASYSVNRAVGGNTGQYAFPSYNQSGTASRAYYYPMANVTKGKTYALSGYIWLNGTASNSSNIVNITDSVNGAVLATVTGNTSNGWQKFTANWTVPFTYTSGTHSINFVSTTNAPTGFLIDDFQAVADSNPALTKAVINNVTVSGSGGAPSTYTFSGASSINVGGASAYTWNWGDGTANVVTASNANVTHTFTTAGTFNVTLTTQNGDGGPTNTATMSISANPAAKIFDSLENGSAYDANWRGTVGSSTTTGSSDGGIVHTGAYSKYTYGYADSTNATRGIRYYPTTLLSANTDYTVSAWVYINSPSLSQTVKLTASDGTVIGSASGTSASGWQKITGTWNTGAAYSTANTYLLFAYSPYYVAYTFNVDDLDVTAIPPYTISTASVPNAVAGSPYSQQLAVTAGTPQAFSSSTLPAGLNVNASGLISGTPTTAGTYTTTINSTSTAGKTASKVYTIVISPNLLTNASFESSPSGTGATSPWYVNAGNAVYNGPTNCPQGTVGAHDGNNWLLYYSGDPGAYTTILQDTAMTVNAGTKYSGGAWISGCSAAGNSGTIYLVESVDKFTASSTVISSARYSSTNAGWNYASITGTAASAGNSLRIQVVPDSAQGNMAFDDWNVGLG